jgi:hypothetical protein
VVVEVVVVRTVPLGDGPCLLEGVVRTLLKRADSGGVAHKRTFPNGGSRTNHCEARERRREGRGSFRFPPPPLFSAASHPSTKDPKKETFIFVWLLKDR